jgi:hypothetical protein
MARPDISDYLAHFTTDRPPVVSNEPRNPTNDVTGTSAYERLISIVQSKMIRASLLPWAKRNAVCFTECPWASLIDHADAYSPYGIGFTKRDVFADGGGPVYYVRPDHWDKQTWDPHLRTFATPFSPKYRPTALQDDKYLYGKTIDYSHEREWRVPHDFTFDYRDISFVVVKTYEDMAKFPQPLKDAIGRDRFLIMEIYRNIERLWPVHVT